MTNCTVSWSWCYQRLKKGAQVRRNMMGQELPAHAGSEEKAMGRSGHYDAISWEDYLSSGAGGSDSTNLKLWSPFSRSWRSSGEVAWLAQSQRLTWNQRYHHQCGSECVRPPHPWLHQLPSHTTPSLPQSPKPCHTVMFDRWNTRQTWNVAGIKAALRRWPAPAKRKKSHKKSQTTESKCSGSVIKITSQKKSS